MYIFQLLTLYPQNPETVKNILYSLREHLKFDLTWIKYFTDSLSLDLVCTIGCWKETIPKTSDVWSDLGQWAGLRTF